MSSQQIVINKEDILSRIRDNGPIISRILSTKTCKYEDYVNNIYFTSFSEKDHSNIKSNFDHDK